MAPDTKIISKKQFEQIKGKFEDRISDSAQREIEKADSEDRLELTIEANSPLHITEVEVISSPDEISIFENA